MDIIKKLSDELGIKLSQVEATVKLIDEGNTIPLLQDIEKRLQGRSMMKFLEI